MTFTKIKRLYRRFKAMHETTPHFVISKSGTETPNPSVNLGLHSKRGMQGIMSRHDDNPGHAQIEIMARSMARLSCLPLLDERDPQNPVEIVVK